MAYALNRNQGSSMTMTASGLDVLAGIWLLISPFVLAFSHMGTACWNDVILGIVIGILALGRFFNPANTIGLAWVNALLGLWVLISPWVLGFGNVQTPMTNNVITGIVVIILACWSALSTPAAVVTNAEVSPERRGL